MSICLMDSGLNNNVLISYVPAYSDSADVSELTEWVLLKDL